MRLTLTQGPRVHSASASARQGQLWYRGRVFPDVSFHGPTERDAEYDQELLAELPPELRALLTEVGGVVAFGGGLHLRGACLTPAWHSLRAAWRGEDALHRHFSAVLPSDVPFAEDCVGDQYLLRGGEVVQLFAEVDEVEPLGLGLMAFIDAALVDAQDTLCTEPLEVFLRDHPALLPEHALEVIPPFCEDADERQLVAVPRLDLTRKHAARARGN